MLLISTYVAHSAIEGLGVFAAAIHWHIRERPVARLVMAAAPA